MKYHDTSNPFFEYTAIVGISKIYKEAYWNDAGDVSHSIFRKQRIVRYNAYVLNRLINN